MPQKAVLLLILSFVLAPPVRAAGDILLGISAAFQGPSKGLGIELYRGAMAYIMDINKKGGINGRTIIVKAYDDNYNPAPAVKNTVRLVERDNALLLFNYVGTPTVTRVLPLLKKYSSRHAILFFPFTGAQPQREPPYGEFVFNLRASYRQETQGLVESFSRIGRSRIAVYYQNDAYGMSGFDGVKRALKKSNRAVAATATYERGSKYASDYSRQVEILRKAQPDAIISVGAYAACAGFIRDARASGWDVPIANVSFVGSESMLGLLIDEERGAGKPRANNLVNSQVVPSYEDATLPAVREYQKLMDAYDPAPPPDVAEAGYKPLRYSFVSLEGFLDAKLLVEILRRMGDRVTDKAYLRQAAEGIRKFDLGIKAPVSFGPDRHQGLDMVYYTTVKDGKFIPMTQADWKSLERKQP